MVPLSYKLQPQLLVAVANLQRSLGESKFFFLFFFFKLGIFLFFYFFSFSYSFYPYFLSPRVCLYRIGQNKSEWDRRFRSAAKALHFQFPPLSLLHITHHHSPFLPNFKNLLIIIYFFYLYLKIFVIFFFHYLQYNKLFPLYLNMGTPPLPMP